MVLILPGAIAETEHVAPCAACPGSGLYPRITAFFRVSGIHGRTAGGGPARGTLDASWSRDRLPAVSSHGATRAGGISTTGRFSGLSDSRTVAVPRHRTPKTT